MVVSAVGSGRVRVHVALRHCDFIVAYVRSFVVGCQLEGLRLLHFGMISSLNVQDLPVFPIGDCQLLASCKH